MASPLSAIILLCSSWLNLVLFATQVVLSILFLRRKRGCTPHQKVVIVGTLIADTVCTIAVCGNTLLYMVIYPNAGKFPAVQTWPLPVTIIATACSALFERSFLAHRYWNLSHNKYFSSLFALLIIGHTILSPTIGIYVVAQPHVEKDFSVTSTTIDVSFAAATDLLLALMIVITLQSLETGYISTKQLIRRVSWISLSAGTLCAMTSTLMLVFFLRQNIIFNLFSACLGRVYSLTILFNFFTIGPRSDTVNVHDTADMINPLTRVTSDRFTLTLPDIRSSIFIDMSDTESCSTQLEAKNGGSDKVTSELPQRPLSLPYLSVP